MPYAATPPDFPRTIGPPNKASPFPRSATLRQHLSSANFHRAELPYRLRSAEYVVKVRVAYALKLRASNPAVPGTQNVRDCRSIARQHNC